MNLDETKNIMRVMSDTYPSFKVTSPTMVETWQILLADIDASLAQKALISYIRTDTSGFAPSVGQIIDHVNKLQSANQLTEMEAWHMVSKAICDSSYHAKERFDELPELVQKAVGSPNVLRDWGQTDVNTLGTVIQSNFIKTYRSVMERDTEFRKLPQNIQMLINKTAERIEAK